MCVYYPPEESYQREIKSRGRGVFYKQNVWKGDKIQHSRSVASLPWAIVEDIFIYCIIKLWLSVFYVDCYSWKGIIADFHWMV